MLSPMQEDFVYADAHMRLRDSASEIPSVLGKPFVGFPGHIV